MKITKQHAVGLLLLAIVLIAPQVYAGAKIEIDDTKWISIGAGLRTSYSSVEDAAPSGSDSSNDFSLNNIRLYMNGQIHKYINFEFNTECTDFLLTEVQQPSTAATLSTRSNCLAFSANRSQFEAGSTTTV